MYIKLQFAVDSILFKLRSIFTRKNFGGSLSSLGHLLRNVGISIFGYSSFDLFDYCILPKAVGSMVSGTLKLMIFTRF